MPLRTPPLLLVVLTWAPAAAWAAPLAPTSTTATATVVGGDPAEGTRAAAPWATDYLRGSDWTDTRLTFAVSTSDLFSGPGERIVPTSGLRLGSDVGTNLPFENLNTRYTGFESLTHLVLHKTFEGLWPRWGAEAAVAVLGAAGSSSGEWSLGLADAGSYIRIVRRLGDGPEDAAGAVDLTAWPISADRFRLGYTYRLSWAGTRSFPGKAGVSSITEGPVPGARLAWRAPAGRAYAFVGTKCAMLLSRAPGSQAGELVPNWAGLAGGGVELGERVIAEVNGGVLEKGTQERTGLAGRSIIAYGASARVTLHDGPVLEPTSPDLTPHGGAADLPHHLSRWVPYVAGTGYSVALEGTLLRQNLEDPDAPGKEKEVTATSAGLVGRAKVDQLLVGLDVLYRSVDFLDFDVPGFVPFQALSSKAEAAPNILFAASVAYAFEEVRPRLTVGLELPAAVRALVDPQQGTVGGAPVGAVRTQIVFDEGTRIVLPEGQDRKATLGALLEVPFAIAEEVTVTGEARWSYDPNMPRLGLDPGLGDRTYRFDSPHRLGLGVVIRAWW